jgi:hypothetical protein
MAIATTAINTRVDDFHQRMQDELGDGLSSTVTPTLLGKSPAAVKRWIPQGLDTLDAARLGGAQAQRWAQAGRSTPSVDVEDPSRAWPVQRYVPGGIHRDN